MNLFTGQLAQLCPYNDDPNRLRNSSKVWKKANINAFNNLATLMYYNKSREKFNHVEQLYEALSFSLDALKRFCVTHSMVREDACSN